MGAAWCLAVRKPRFKSQLGSFCEEIACSPSACVGFLHSPTTCFLRLIGVSNRCACECVAQQQTGDLFGVYPALLNSSCVGSGNSARGHISLMILKSTQRGIWPRSPVTPKGIQQVLKKDGKKMNSAKEAQVSRTKLF